MKYVKIEDGGIIKQGRPGAGQRRLDNGAWVTPLNGEWSHEELAVVGWVEVTQEPKPEFDAATHTVRALDPVVQTDGSVVAGWEITELSPADVLALQAKSARDAALEGIDMPLLVKASSDDALTDSEIRQLIKLVAMARLQADIG